MTPLGLPSLDKISALPADVLAALRTIPEIVENTRAMKEHTAQLARVADALDRVAADTAALPACARKWRGERHDRGWTRAGAVEAACRSWSRSGHLAAAELGTRESRGSTTGSTS